MALLKRTIQGDVVTCSYESANILLTEYQMSKQVLDVTFKNGAKYRYFHVTPADHAGIQLAESAGQYFHKNIRTHAFKKL